MAKVVLFGTGQLAAVVHEYLTHDSPHEVVAFTVDGSRMGVGALAGLPVVPFEEVRVRFPPRHNLMMIAIGYNNMNRSRAGRFEQAKTMGYELPSYVSSRAMVWHDLVLGENVLILEGSIIQPFVRIENDVIISPGVCIGHDSVIKDHCFLAAGADVSGDVTIEPYSFLGANCTIRNGVKIARETAIGAHVAVLRSTKEREVYASSGSELLPLTSDKLPGT